MSSIVKTSTATTAPTRSEIYILLVRCSQLIRQARRRSEDHWARFWTDEAQYLRRLLENPAPCPS